MHFIGFAREPARRALLRKAGAAIVTVGHAGALAAIHRCLAGQAAA